MSSLWATNDILKQERLNRSAIAARYALPLYDVDDADAVTVEALKTGGALGTSLTTMYTAAGEVDKVHSIVLTNISGANRVVSLYRIEPGASTASVARQIWADTLTPGETVLIPVPFHLATGGSIRGLTDAVTSVYFSVNAVEFTDQPAGLRLKVVEGSVMTTGGATEYTCPGDVTHAILLAVTVCNSTASPVAVQVAEAGVVWFVLTTLAPKETLVIEPHQVLTSGDAIASLAGTSSAVSCHLTILEVE